MSKRRPLLSLLLMVSMLLLAACAQHPHHHYYGVASTTPPAMTGVLEWDRTGSTANGALTLGGVSEPTTGLPPGTYLVAITFTADRFAGVVSDTGGQEVANASGNVTATGVDLTIAAPGKAPATISFKSTQPGAYTYSPTTEVALEQAPKFVRLRGDHAG